VARKGWCSWKYVYWGRKEEGSGPRSLSCGRHTANTKQYVQCPGCLRADKLRVKDVAPSGSS
jgi:hypothetical protein